MRYIKRLITAVTACLLIALVAMPKEVYAYSPQIYSIDIFISLNQDGSADVTETWDVQVADGTEWYLVQGNLGKIEIQDFSVQDETGKLYENEGSWDIDRSLEQKAGKCGIVDKGSGNYELCWGVGSYGDHIYTVNYHMTDFVKGFDDYCGFNQRVINDQLSSNPQRISVTVTKPGTEFTTEDVGVWAFGFEGSIWVENGMVSATSNGAIGSDDYVTVMCRFPRDMFDTTNVVGGSFDEMKERAFEGSDYTSDESLAGIEKFLDNMNWDSADFIINTFKYSFIGIIILTFIAIFVVAKKNGRVTTFEVARENMRNQKNVKFYAKPLFWAIFIVTLIVSPIFAIIFFVLILTSSKKDGDEASVNLTGNAYPLGYMRKELSSEQGYSREVPFDCNIATISTAGTMTGVILGKNNIIGAYLLKWLQSGDIEIRQVRKSGVSGSLGQETPSVVLCSMPVNVESAAERHLYQMLDSASGGDHILQEKEMYKWARKHYVEVNAMMKAFDTEGKSFMTDHEYLGKIPSTGLFGFSYVPQDAFTESGRAEITNLCKFRNFLKDFTLINERAPQEVFVWDQYLIVAQIFGVADQIAAQFRKIYPDYFTDHATYYNDYIGSYGVINAISSAGVNGASSASSGGGGSSSGGGGGGSSGGGSGGGSR